MQTRITLHGGNSSRNSKKNIHFFQEVTNGVASNNVRVLCVYFARPEGRWGESYKKDHRSFKNVSTNKDVQTAVAAYMVLQTKYPD